MIRERKSGGGVFWSFFLQILQLVGKSTEMPGLFVHHEKTEENKTKKRPFFMVIQSISETLCF